MNYCDKIHYNIYTTGLATFGEMVDALLAQLPQDEQILRLAFFGMPNDNEQYVSRRIMLREKIRKFYGNHEPVLSYVSQPPLNAGLILEVHSYKADEDDHITFRRHGGFPYVVLENADGRLYLDKLRYPAAVRRSIPHDGRGDAPGRLPRKLHHPPVELHRADHPLRRAGPALPDVQQRPCRFLWKDGLEQRLSGCYRYWGQLGGHTGRFGCGRVRPSRMLCHPDRQ